ncbi:MAG: hypothetical protein HS111_20725 [Kofleriaceae bacterium]|nr:hypothetical protein [Kofleriaceae bacterium]
MTSDGKRPGPSRGPVTLPLPPPLPEAEDGTSRVRMSMSSYVPETTARDLPVLPAEAWLGDDTDDELFESVTAAVPRGNSSTRCTRCRRAPALAAALSPSAALAAPGASFAPPVTATRSPA